MLLVHGSDYDEDRIVLW